MLFGRPWTRRGERELCECCLGYGRRREPGVGGRFGLARRAAVERVYEVSVHRVWRRGGCTVTVRRRNAGHGRNGFLRDKGGAGGSRGSEPVRGLGKHGRHRTSDRCSCALLGMVDSRERECGDGVPVGASATSMGRDPRRAFLESFNVLHCSGTVGGFLLEWGPFLVVYFCLGGHIDVVANEQQGTDEAAERDRGENGDYRRVCNETTPKGVHAHVGEDGANAAAGGDEDKSRGPEETVFGSK